MTNPIFMEDEFPYDVLGKFGLTKEMILDLPQDMLQRICKGRHSPVLPITYVTCEGATVKAQARFRLITDDNGEVRALFAPKLVHADLARFNDDQREALAHGDAVFAKFPDKDGVVTAAFYQIDPATEQVVSVPSPVIGYNLQILLELYSLKDPELDTLREGEPVTIYHEDKPVTMGIDLLSPHGVRVEHGDEEHWRAHAKCDYQRETFNFGINGCWIADEDGAMSYVPEREYTDEMWNEQKRLIERNNLKYSR